MSQLEVKNKRHVCVIGAGIVGATTAYALSRAGWNVTVVDAEGEAAMGTSFANGAQLSYSYVEPLATPYALKKIPIWLLSSNSPVRWYPQMNINHVLWLINFISCCNPLKVKKTTKELLSISSLTRSGLQDLLADLDIKEDEIFLEKTGKLVVYRNHSERAAVQKQLDLQKLLGCHQEILDAAACVEHEPSLSNIGKEIAFGVYTPSEEAVDCRKLSKLILERSGVKQMYGLKVLGFCIDDGKVKALETTKDRISADQFVIAAGMGTNKLLKKINKSLLIEPIKGYSVSFPIENAKSAPKGSVTDQNRKVVFARIGNTLRVAGFAEIIGENLDIDQKRIDSLIADTERVFPGAVNTKNYSPWAGLRPASPSGIPYIQTIGYENLWVNAGHGSLGLTLSIGSAELLVKKMGCM